jgi:hypothetical protein
MSESENVWNPSSSGSVTFEADADNAFAPYGAQTLSAGEMLYVEAAAAGGASTMSAPDAAGWTKTASGGTITLRRDTTVPNPASAQDVADSIRCTAASTSDLPTAVDLAFGLENMQAFEPVTEGYSFFARVAAMSPSLNGRLFAAEGLVNAETGGHNIIYKDVDDTAFRAFAGTSASPLLPFGNPMSWIMPLSDTVVLVGYSGEVHVARMGQNTLENTGIALTDDDRRGTVGNNTFLIIGANVGDNQSLLYAGVVNATTSGVTLRANGVTWKTS